MLFQRFSLLPLAVILLLSGCMSTVHPNGAIQSGVDLNHQQSSGESADHSAEKEASNSSGRAAMVEIGGIKWYVGYDDALIAARKSKRPIWLHFGENPG